MDEARRFKGLVQKAEQGMRNAIAVVREPTPNELVQQTIRDMKGEIRRGQEAVLLTGPVEEPHAFEEDVDLAKLYGRTKRKKHASKGSNSNCMNEVEFEEDDECPWCMEKSP